MVSVSASCVNSLHLCVSLQIVLSFLSACFVSVFFLPFVGESGNEGEEMTGRTDRDEKEDGMNGDDTNNGRI